MMNTKNKLRLQQTLQNLSHLDLTDHIVAADVAVQLGGGGFGDIYQSELSTGWQTRYDQNLMTLLELENGKLMSTPKPGNSETTEFPLAAASVTFDCTKVAVKIFRVWGKTDQKVEKVLLGAKPQ